MNLVLMEGIDLKAAPTSNGRFSKSDVTAENATLPDETPVLQYSVNVHPSDTMADVDGVLGLDAESQARYRVSVRSWLSLVLSVVYGVDTM